MSDHMFLEPVELTDVELDEVAAGLVTVVAPIKVNNVLNNNSILKPNSIFIFI